MPQGIFRDGPGFEKLQKIIRAAGFGADTGKLQTAEWLALDYGAGDAAVDVKIEDAKLSTCSLDMPRFRRGLRTAKAEEAV